MRLPRRSYSVAADCREYDGDTPKRNERTGNAPQMYTAGGWRTYPSQDGRTWIHVPRSDSVSANCRDTMLIDLGHTRVPSRANETHQPFAWRVAAGRLHGCLFAGRFPLKRRAAGRLASFLETPIALAGCARILTSVSIRCPVLFVGGERLQTPTNPRTPDIASFRIPFIPQRRSAASFRPARPQSASPSQLEAGHLGYE